MMVQKLIFPGGIIAILAVVVVVLLIVCGCLWGKNGNESTVICGNEKDYEIQMQKKKETEFAVFKTIDGPDFDLSLSISEAIQLKEVPLLNKDFFERSIEANSEDPYGTKFQKYNYVVCRGAENETIWVARWQDTVDFAGISRNCPGPKFELQNRQGMMINIFPEDKDAKIVDLRGQQTPCWLDGLDPDPEEKKLKSKVETGLLDAISKHYMIAQGPRAQASEKITIAKFDAEKWSKTRVRYAGEIIVDVEKCEYWLNNGSGTYQPKGLNKSGQDELQAVAQLFSDTLGVSPTFVIDTDGTTSHGGIPTPTASGQLAC